MDCQFIKSGRLIKRQVSNVTHIIVAVNTTDHYAQVALFLKVQIAGCHSPVFRYKQKYCITPFTMLLTGDKAYNVALRKCTGCINTSIDNEKLSWT